MLHLANGPAPRPNLRDFNVAEAEEAISVMSSPPTGLGTELPSLVLASIHHPSKVSENGGPR